MTISVICHKDRTNKNGIAPIVLRFTHNRKVRYVSTGVNVNTNDWDFDKHRIKADAQIDCDLQYRIDTKLHEYNKKMRRLEALDIEATFDSLLIMM